jgi:tRNA G10  N-methylase Trm11
VPVRLKVENYPIGHPLREKTASRLDELSNMDVFQRFSKIVDENIKRLNDFELLDLFPVGAEVISQDARNLKYDFDKRFLNKVLPDMAVDLIITSPPYAGAQKYIRASSLCLGWLEMAEPKDLKILEGMNIGREHYRKSEYQLAQKSGLFDADELLLEIQQTNPLRAHIATNYLLEMRSALLEAYRVLKRGGYMVLVAANNQVCGQEFRTQEFLKRIAIEIGFEVEFQLIDAIKSYGLMTKRNKTANLITREWVTVFRKQ